MKTKFLFSYPNSVALKACSEGDKHLTLVVSGYMDNIMYAVESQAKILVGHWGSGNQKEKKTGLDQFNDSFKYSLGFGWNLLRVLM